MTLDDLAVALRARGIDLGAEYSQFIARTGKDDVDLFLGDLRARDVIDGDQLRALHGSSDIAVARLVDVQGGTLVLEAPRPTLVLERGAAPGPGGTLVLQGTAPAAAPAAAATSARHVMLGRVGRGAMGEVQVAFDVELHRKVAFKRLVPELASKPQVVSRFFSEVQITAQLDHPNVVPIYGVEVSPDGTIGYAMKLVQGRTLTSVIADDRAAVAREGAAGEARRLSLRLEVFLKICDAMSYAHKKKVLHRDLKPDNVMVGAFNEVYVMDWGICRLIGERDDDAAVTVSYPAQPDRPRTRYGAVLGTAEFMSPEQAAGKAPDLDARSDVYALGAILFELVALRPARVAKDAEHALARAIRGERDPLVHDVPSIRIARELRAIIARAMAPAPAARYPSAAALADDVRRHLRGDAVSALRDGPLARAARWVGRHRTGAALALALLALAGAGATAGVLAVEQRQLRRARLHEERLQEFLEDVAQRSHELDNYFYRRQIALVELAGRAAELLAAPPPARPLYRASDFDVPGRAPRDLALAQAWGHAISFDFPVVHMPAGVGGAAADADARRLVALVPAFRRQLVGDLAGDSERAGDEELGRRLREGDPPALRVSVTLDSGVHVSYPGMGGFPAGYDGRRRPKYTLAAGERGVRWGTPFPDRYGMGAILPASVALYDAADRFRGVAAVEVPADWVGRHLLELPFAPAAIATFLVDGEGHVVVGTGDGAPAPARSATPASGDDRLALPPFPLPAVATAMQRGRPGHVDVPGARPRLVAFYPLESLGWSYAVIADQQTLFAP